MRIIVKMLVIYMFVAIAGCAITGGTPQQSVYAIKSEYQLALSAAVAYKGLPSCATVGHPLVCSDAVVVAKIQQADSVAGPAIQQAENAVRDPSFDASTTSKILVAAQAALNALTAITAQLPKGAK